jgi:ribosomal-protein-alanine N-acetyltransferase|tara:strand:+ start:3038 stop:3580 length:543 start_codon:yes stop_codon:yes gene_type:complete
MSIEKPTSIKTKRLILRPIVLSDLETIQDYSLDDEWNRFLDFHTKESVREFVEKAVNSDWEDNSRFMISYNKNIIGSVGLYINQKEKHAEIGYSLSKKYWGKGIIPEAVNEIFIYGFSELGLDKIFAQTDLMNLPSQSVMKKMNMVQEGIFRKHVIQKNIRRDVVYFSILKTEWEENKLK